MLLCHPLFCNVLELTVLGQVPFGEGTLAALAELCRERIWPLKNSTRIGYDFFLDTHLLPNWDSVKLTKMNR
jgi:hypothetical protein